MRVFITRGLTRTKISRYSRTASYTFVVFRRFYKKIYQFTSYKFVSNPFTQPNIPHFPLMIQTAHSTEAFVVTQRITRCHIGNLETGI